MESLGFNRVLISLISDKGPSLTLILTMRSVRIVSPTEIRSER